MFRRTFLFCLVVLLPGLAFGADSLALKDITKLSFSDAETTAEGVVCSFDLGTKRCNWTNAKWSVLELEKTVDLSEYQAVQLVVTTEKKRADAGVYVAFREADGSWYSHPWACDLTQGENEGVARFADFDPPYYHQPPNGDFKDENLHFDPKSVKAIAIGVVNPFGVGVVSFTLKSMHFIRVSAVEPKSVEVSVTGKLLDVNGTINVPAGVFGGFNLKDIPLGDAWVQIGDAKYTVKEGKVVVDGTEYTVNRGRVKIGNNNYSVNQEAMARTARYRLASDKRIMYGGRPAAPVYGNKITHMIINNAGDRTESSFRLTDPNWKASAEAAGKSYGEAVLADGKTAYLEFWNEPYLNWANDNRKNFDPGFFDISKATEGGPVHGKFDGVEMPHLRWTKDFNAPPWQWCRYGLQEWRRGKDEKGKLSVDKYARPYSIKPPQWREMIKANPPDDVKDGATYTFGNRTFTAFTPWHVYDETQFTYWSGKGMLKPYIDSLLAYGTPLKQTAGDKVVLIAGWGNRPSEDHWAGFFQLYKPTIDATVGIIDAVNDHDYGGNPIKIPASYEVVTAYGMNQHKKWLYHYNTETASAFDPEATGDGGTKVSGDASKFQWVSRKIANALDTCPGKVRNFAHFGVGGGWWSDTGEGVAMDIMRNVRGRLVQSVDADEKVYVIACIDGSDPQNPRPADMPEGQELAVLIFNDHPGAIELDLTLTAPEGTKFRKGIMKWGDVNWSTGAVEIKKMALDASGTTHNLKSTIPPKTPVVVTLPLDTPIAADTKATVFRKQFFGSSIIQEVTGGEAINDAIKLDGVDLSKVHRAWLSIVVERLAHGEGLVELNGSLIELPGMPTPENSPMVCRVPVDVAKLKAENAVAFKTTKPTQAGYLLGMCSLIVESE